MLLQEENVWSCGRSEMRAGDNAKCIQSPEPDQLLHPHAEHPDIVVVPSDFLRCISIYLKTKVKHTAS